MLGRNFPTGQLTMLASGGSGRAARPGSSPVGAEFPGAHGGLSPERYRGACVRVYMCVVCVRV